MEIDRKWWAVGIFAFIIFSTTIFYLTNPPLDGFNSSDILGIIILFGFVALIAIGCLFVNEKNEKKVNYYVRLVSVILLTIAGGNILGFKLHTIWEYLVGFVLLFILYEYVLVNIFNWIKDKTRSLHTKIEHNTSKRLKKRYE